VSHCGEQLRPELFATPLRVLVLHVGLKPTRGSFDRQLVGIRCFANRQVDLASNEARYHICYDHFILFHHFRNRIRGKVEDRRPTTARDESGLGIFLHGEHTFAHSSPARGFLSSNLLRGFFGNFLLVNIPFDESILEADYDSSTLSPISDPRQVQGISLARVPTEPIKDLMELARTRLVQEQIASLDYPEGPKSLKGITFMPSALKGITFIHRIFVL